MLYSLFQLLEDTNLPGRYLMDFVSFRAGITFSLALLLALFCGQAIIRRLQKMHGQKSGRSCFSI